MKFHEAFIGSPGERKGPIWIKAESVDKGYKYISKDQMLQTWCESEDFETQNYLSCHNMKNAHRIHSPQ